MAPLPFKLGFPPNWISGLEDRDPQCCANREAPAQTHLCLDDLNITAHVISTVCVTFKASFQMRNFRTGEVPGTRLWCGLLQ